jgi:hypothetical protein
MHPGFHIISQPLVLGQLIFGGCAVGLFERPNVKWHSINQFGTVWKRYFLPLFFQPRLQIVLFRNVPFSDFYVQLLLQLLHWIYRVTEEGLHNRFVRQLGSGALSAVLPRVIVLLGDGINCQDHIFSTCMHVLLKCVNPRSAHFLGES